MGAFMIHHNEELMVSQHLRRIWLGRKTLSSALESAALKLFQLYPSAFRTHGPRARYSQVSLQPPSLDQVLWSVHLPSLGGVIIQPKGAQVMAGRGKGWGGSSPIIFKIDPDDGPHHDEGAGYSYQAQRREKERKGYRKQGRGHERGI